MILMKRGMIGIRWLWRDARRILRAVGTFLRYLLSKQDRDIGIGLFSAASGRARRGQPNDYVVRVANASRSPLRVILCISIMAAKTVGPSEGHHASFTKELTLQPRTSTVIAIQYDWMGQAEFQIDGVSSPHDDFWRGTIEMPQLYSLTASLRDITSTPLDTLTVYQELVD
jgi:hypothetical protein